MARQPSEGALLAVLSTAMRLTDRELLARFNDGDQTAFAAIVKRHYGMVIGACRRMLPTLQDAEDACQVAFLVLARKAKTVRWQSSIASWLYTTARRIATKASRAAAQRIKRESLSVPSVPVSALDKISLREAIVVLDEELDKLPAIYREPLVLCYVQGLTRDEAASRLEIPSVTLKSQLNRGRKKLADALTKRGIDIGAGLLAVAATSSVGASSLKLVESILATVGGSPSASVAALAKGIAMNGFSLKVKMMALAMAAVVVAGFGLASMQIAAEPQKPAESLPDSKPLAAKALDFAPDIDAKPRATRLDHFSDPLPEEALARFGTVRFRQGLIVNAIRYSPDEKTIAIAGNGRRLGLWDVATGKELFQFDDATGGFPSCYAIAFSPDGKTLAAPRRDNVQLWNTRTGELIREFKGHTASPMALIFSADGKTIISGGHDKTIRFWDVATGLETAKLEKHADSVLALTLSNDGKQLASGGSDKIIRVWDVQTHGLLQELRGQQGSVSILSFSPDGKRLVATGGYKQPCLVFDVNKGEAAYTLDEEHNSVRTAVFSPNGKWLAAGCSDGTIRLHEPSTGKEIRRWETQGFAVHKLVFTKNSKVIAASSAWESVRFWDVETGKDTSPLDVHRSLIEDLKVSPDGKSVWAVERDRRVIRWNAATAQPTEVIPIPSPGFLWSNGALSPDGAFLAWGSKRDKVMHIMDLKTGKDACEPLKTETGPLLFQFSPDGKMLAVGCREGFLYIWKWQTVRNPKPLKAPDGDQIWPRLFTPDGKHLVTGSFEGQSDLMHVWDVAAGKTTLSFGGNKTSNALAASPDGKWLVSTFGRDTTVGGHIKVIDFENGKIVREIKVDPEGGMVLAFSPDGRVLAFGHDERRRSDVKLIEFATGEAIATFEGHHSGVSTLQFAPDGRTLYSGGCDSTILKWDATARHGKGPSTTTTNATAAWGALAQEASKAYPARWDLIDAPKEAVALLRKKILPAKKLDRKVVQRAIDDLDSDEFQDRQKAAVLLKSFGYSVEPLLRKIVETEIRVEVKESLQKLIDEMNGATFLRIQRAMQVLETIGNDDAKQLLRELADGTPESMLTKEAAMVLKRIAK